MLAVGFIPRLDGARNPRRVSDGSLGERFAKRSGVPSTPWRGRPRSTVADATESVGVAIFRGLKHPG